MPGKLKFDAVRELNRVLADRIEPLLIKIDDNSCIVAAHFSYDTKHSIGIVLRHPEGPIDIGVSPVSDMEQDGVEEWAESVDANLTDGLPGLAIIAGMTEEELHSLGLRAVDEGGPASSVPMVEFSGDVHAFQEALTSKNLPYRLVFRTE